MSVIDIQEEATMIPVLIEESHRILILVPLASENPFILQSQRSIAFDYGQETQQPNHCQHNTLVNGGLIYLA